MGFVGVVLVSAVLVLVISGSLGVELGLVGLAVLSSRGRPSPVALQLRFDQVDPDRVLIAEGMRDRIVGLRGCPSR